MRRLIAAVIVLLFILPAATSDSEYNRFGIVEGFWFPELTCDLGVGWERIIFNWEQHQPNGVDDWFTLNVDDRWLSAAAACDREIVALLKHTPAWATDGTAGIGVPRGLTLPVDDPDNLWANFVRRTVDYYASRGVYRFIIWNEPDIDSETYGYEFEGTLEDYYQMVRVASIVAKQTNPAAKIHLAGTTYWHDVNEGRQPYMTRLVERIMADPAAAEHDYYFDVLSLHIYFRTESVYDITHEMREMLDGHGLTDKAIWINETNAAPTIDPAWPVQRPVFNLDLDHQANFMIQSAALSLAAGVERVAAYKLYDQQLPPGGESFGLLSPPTAEPRPAFRAWQTVTSHFADVESASLARAPLAEAVRLQHQGSGQTIVVWARTDRTVTVEIEVDSDKVYQFDSYGNITVVRSQSGAYRFDLPSALCERGEGCFLGGQPRIISTPWPITAIRIVAPETTPLVFD